MAVPPDKRKSNRRLLDEVNAAGSWFRARKTHPIWARVAGRRQTVSSLEGPEEVKKGDYICRGSAGELWPQAAESLRRKYRETGEVDRRDRRWRKFAPRPAEEGVLAARIDRRFTVHTSWGTLRGKKGDFLVKEYADREDPYPDDVWIVDQERFALTYEAIEESEAES